jgi:hypothetical protein
MKLLKTSLPVLAFLLPGADVFAQTDAGDIIQIFWNGLSDHPFSLSSKNRKDTAKWIIENKSKTFLLGNSTYVAVATTFSNSGEYEVSIGRTKCISTNYGRGVGYTNMGSWGFSFFTKDNLNGSNRGGKVFLEYNHRPYWILGSFVLRADYSYNFTNRQQYITPSAGISIMYLDVLYNYSFPLNLQGDKNYYKDGLTLRLKYLLGKKKCEINKPAKCGC